MLFPKRHSPHGPARHNGHGHHAAPAGGDAIIVTPDLMRRQVCRRPDRHIIEVPMVFVRAELNGWGQPTTVWRCPACVRLRGVCKDFKTGLPRSLWQKDAR